MVWAGLSDDDKKALKEAAIEAGKLNRELSVKADTELREKMTAAGVAINEVDQAPFAEKTKSVYDKWSKEYPDLVKLITTEAAK
ncbi:MAG: TRAP transporter substrate-binding protein, partial [Thiothrix sp.]